MRLWILLKPSVLDGFADTALAGEGGRCCLTIGSCREKSRLDWASIDTWEAAALSARWGEKCSLLRGLH